MILKILMHHFRVLLLIFFFYSFNIIIFVLHTLHILLLQISFVHVVIQPRLHLNWFFYVLFDDMSKSRRTLLSLLQSYITINAAIMVPSLSAFYQRYHLHFITISSPIYPCKRHRIIIVITTVIATIIATILPTYCN